MIAPYWIAAISVIVFFFLLGRIMYLYLQGPSRSKSLDPVLIDMSYHIVASSLWSRKILQVLFNAYRSGGGNLDEIGDFFCDYTLITQIIDEGDFEFDFSWSFSDGITELNRASLYTTVSDHYYRVSSDGKIIKIERIDAK